MLSRRFYKKYGVEFNSLGILKTIYLVYIENHAFVSEITDEQMRLLKRFLYHWSINKDARELIYYMRMVIDPRCGRKTKHDHAEILTCLVVGYLAGRDSVRRCLKWCENHIDFLRQHLELKNGIASPATVSRILGNIDEEIFCLAFIEWMTGILNTKGINIAIDGKALRGSTEKDQEQTDTIYPECN